MKQWTALALGVCLVLSTGARTLAEEEAAPVAPTMHTAIHWIGSLTQGRTTFREQPLGTIHRRPAGLDYPEFGETRERFYPWGMADELIELIKVNVTPRFWEETDGASVSRQHESYLVIRATRTIHDAISKYLTSLEQDARPVRVDLVAVQASSAALARFAARNRTSWTQDELQQLPGRRTTASVLTTDGQNATIARGTHRARVVGMAPVVKDGAALQVPTVDVGRYGLLANVRPLLAPGGEARVQLAVSLGSTPPRRGSPTGRLDLEPVHIASWNVDANVRREHWTYIGSAAGGVDNGAHWSLFARVSASEAPASPARADFLPTIGQPTGAPMTLRRYPVADLLRSVRDLAPSYHSLRGSYEDAPEAPEPGQHEMLWSGDTLAELIMYGAGTEADWEEGTLNVLNGQALVRNGPHVQEAVVGLLGLVRRFTHRSIVLDTEILEASTTGRPEVRSSVTVHARSGQRNFTEAVRRHRYVGRFEPMVRGGGALASPVQLDVDLGLTVEMNPIWNTAGDGIQLDLRFVEQSMSARSATRRFDVGNITLPTVGVHRGQTAVRLRFGEPTTVFETWDGERTRVVRVTARRAP